MAYELAYRPTAAKELAALDRPDQLRVKKFLDEIIRQGPRSKGSALQGPERQWRYRVGSIRVIVDIADDVVTVTVIKIGRRGQVYRE